MHRDILELLPDDFKEWVDKTEPSCDIIRGAMQDVELRVADHDNKSRSIQAGDLGHIHCARSHAWICSLARRRRGTSGPTGIVLLVQVALLLRAAPIIVVFENARPFLADTHVNK